MNSVWFFLPALFFLVTAGFGLFCVWLAGRLLKRSAQPKSSGQAQPPPLPGRPKARPVGPVWWQLLRVAGLLAFVLGGIGVWKSGLVVGWQPLPTQPWSDGSAPALEPLLRKHCEPFIKSGRTIGLVVAVVTPTDHAMMTFGRPALSADGTVQSDTLFEIGSLTKTFTSLALAQEIENGQLSLDQKVQELLPTDVRLPEPASKITLKHLVTHTSGFPRLPSNLLSIRATGSMLLFGGDPYARYTEENFKEGLRTVELESDPGKKMSYSNFGIGLLGWLLLRHDSTSYDQVIRHNVCEPLGMPDTVLKMDASQKARFAQGYRAVLRCGPLVFALRSAPWLDMEHLAGAGGLHSTGNDLLRYLQANMHPTGQPNEKALRRSHLPLFQEKEHQSIAMNWIVTENQRLQRTLIWHNGATGGFCSFLGFTDDGRYGVLVLSNTLDPADDLCMALLKDLVPTVKIPSVTTGSTR